MVVMMVVVVVIVVVMCHGANISEKMPDVPSCGDGE